MTPTAPWIRSLRAASRSDVWSRNLPKAASWAGVRGSMVSAVWKIRTPHGLMSSPSVPASARGHSAWITERAVADELAGEVARRRPSQELGGLDLLPHDQRLLLGARPRLVVALEGEEDDEPEQHREPGGEHAEDARGAVAVGEAAALGRAPAHEQHRRHREGGDRDDDERRPDEVHRAAIASARAAPCSARRQPESTACTCSAPTIGSSGGASVTGIEDERARLRPAQAAVEGDQLLERAAFLEVRVVEAADHDVGHVREAVRAQQVAGGARREGRQRVVALDAALGEVVRPGRRRARRARARRSGRAASRRAGACGAPGSGSGAARRSPRA